MGEESKGTSTYNRKPLLALRTVFKAAHRWLCPRSFAFDVKHGPGERGVFVVGFIASVIFLLPFPFPLLCFRLRLLFLLILFRKLPAFSYGRSVL